jgi:hypothetical protein
LSNELAKIGEASLTLDQAWHCSLLTFSIHSTALPPKLFLDGDMGPFPEGCEPLLLMSIFLKFSS